MNLPGKISYRKLSWPEAGVSGANLERNPAGGEFFLQRSTINYFIYSIIFLTLISSLLFCGCTSPQDVVAIIDDEPITRNQLKTRLNAYDEKATFATATDSETQTQFTNAEAALTQLINERLLLIEARKLKLLADSDRDDPGKCKQAIRKVLIRLGEKVVFPSYQEAFTYYNQHRNKFSSKTRYQLEHLLLKSENLAWELKEQLEKGELSIADATHRQTPGIQSAKIDNQRLITVDEMPVVVAAILPDLKINQISPPIATPYGFHLIIIRKIVPAGNIPFPEVENRIKDLLFAERLKKNYQNWLELSRKQHTIKIYHKYLSGL
ncbi:MAG TPA: hypothetical protein EYP64_05035 [Desulfarculaceae bacterium]|nr:hypothetical protein [Desulfarculaceae bacterium]